MERMYELKNQRAALLDEAQKALDAHDMDKYNAKMQEVKALNSEIGALEQLNIEKGRFSDSDADMVTAAEAVQKKKEEQSTQNRLNRARSGNEYVNAFADALRTGARVGRDKSEKLEPLYNALSIGGGDPAGSDGGFLVPVEFDNMIHRVMKDYVRLSDYFRVETVSGYSGWRAIETTALRKPLLKIGEAEEIGKDDQPSFRKVEYSVDKYGDRIEVSNELLADNTAGLLQYIAEWFGPRVVITENALLLALLDALTAKNFTSGKEMSELKSLLNKGLNTAISRNAVILTNGNGYDFFDQLEDKNGRPMLVPNPQDPDIYRFKGRRVTYADADLLPSRTVTTTGSTKGDYDPVYIGFFKAFGTLFRRQALEFKTTDVGGNAWSHDTTELRGIVRMCARTVDTDAAVKREIFTPASA
ncbi:MAG TPA: phage major capsid protein [Candidatus Fimivicinus intestinavium]|nr:phage major capsid protein [Candidatus Fimivicinus intestinavium]